MRPLILLCAIALAACQREQSRPAPPPPPPPVPPALDTYRSPIIAASPQSVTPPAVPTWQPPGWVTALHGLPANPKQALPRGAQLTPQKPVQFREKLEQGSDGALHAAYGLLVPGERAPVNVLLTSFGAKAWELCLSNPATVQPEQLGPPGMVKLLGKRRGPHGRGYLAQFEVLGGPFAGDAITQTNEQPELPTNFICVATPGYIVDHTEHDPDMHRLVPWARQR